MNLTFYIWVALKSKYNFDNSTVFIEQSQINIINRSELFINKHYR